MLEIEESIDENSIFFLTETHKRDNSIRIREKFDWIHKPRDINSKKGGGCMIIWQKSEDMKMEMIKTKEEDILMVKISVRNYNFMVMLVYMSVTDYILNTKIIREIKHNLDKYENNDIMLIGDLNAHIGILGPV